jgi:CheY-like chemotaxis protein
MLERQGYAVLEAGDGDAALRLFAGGADVDLVVTDVVMPGLSGRALAERIAAERPGTRVMFMSGYTDDEIFRRGLAVPGAVFLAKPFTRDELLDAVRTALGSRAGPT